MHGGQTLTLLTLLLRTSTAFVPFAYSLHPDIDMATVSPPTFPLEPTTLTHSASPASTPLSISDPTPSPSPSQPEEPSPVELKERQIQVTAPAATLAANPDQVSPITTVEVDSIPPGGGAPVKVPVVYTQLFEAVPDQWELAGVGSIGMGTIEGQIGVVKTKRFVPFIPEEGGEMVVTASSFTA